MRASAEPTNRARDHYAATRDRDTDLFVNPRIEARDVEGVFEVA